ncbi:MAG: tRNA (adenine-N1)-methyltransferase [Endomicrobia bacterium]|nr:tRNA (adenine-N1)-methyltransferase [Endomicrobiia bacterium]MCX7940637.1 tRNA (adenine-N1)-methyltransferase [Endomicrobiia bacterium]MDW8056518.1 tRNA (adenine-N1)-methyltransferase [Elusimicrobiota bacterium]
MFKEKDFVLLIDTKGRKYVFKLQQGGVFSYHKGQVAHESIINKEEGIIIHSSLNEKLIALKPTLAEFVLYKLKRGGQIIYPKDIGQILVLLDIFPGARVLECGCGSGALTLFLLRMVGENGKVVAVDIREDMIEVAKQNIENFYNKPIEEIKNLQIIQLDFKQGINDKNFDRVIVDISDPWEVLENVYSVLSASGIVSFWLPTVLQVFSLVDKLEKEYKDKFYLQGIYETFQRHWEKKELSLRPAHRMVAHTGFLIVCEKLSIVG